MPIRCEGITCGWSSGTEDEVLSLPELVERFSLDRVNRTGAIFDHAKLDWFNGIWIRKLPTAELAQRMRPFLGEAAAGADDATVTAIAGLARERLPTLADARELAEYLLGDRLNYDPALLLQRGMTRDQTLDGLTRGAELAQEVDPFVAATLEPTYRALADDLGLKPVQLFMSIRVACTGRTASPPLFATMEVLGRESVVARLREAVARL